MKKIDLHTHTVSTVSDYPFDFDLSKVKEYVDKLQIDALAITNHNVFDMNQYNQIRNSLTIPVFPGIEIDLEGGHLLLITDTDEFEVSNFDEKCKQVSALIGTKDDSITLAQFNSIFTDVSKYILIPHHDKSPEIKQSTITALNPHVTSGEVASISKFKRLFKEQNGLTPVLFSDMRFKTELKDFPTRHTFVDLKDISLAGIKSCLADKSKISLTKESGNDFFQATDDGLKLSTGLNIVLGERSSGKTVTLNKIASSSGNAKYIRQFSLLQNDEETFNRTNDSRLSIIHNNYLNELKSVIEDVIQIDITQNHLNIESYLDSLKKFATENEKKDLFSKCTLFSEDIFSINDLKNLDKVIESVTTLIENNEYQDIIVKYISTDNLKKLLLELIEKAISSKKDNEEKIWLNSIIKDIKRELGIKTTNSVIEEIDYYKIALDEIKVRKFEEVVSKLKTERQINREELGKFSIVTSTQIITGASDLQKIAHDKKAYSPAFGFYGNPYEYLLKLKETGVEEAGLYKFFIKIESETLNKDGFKVSGGERSEFNLIHEIKDATKYDILLIDEPESSFDNLFLKKEINTLIKSISELMPVVVVTHNSTVGASIKPNYVVRSNAEHWFSDSKVSTIFSVFQHSINDEPTKFITINFKLEEYFEQQNIATQLKQIEEFYGDIDLCSDSRNKNWKVDSTFDNLYHRIDGLVSVSIVSKVNLAKSIESEDNWDTFFISSKLFEKFDSQLTVLYPDIIDAFRGERTGWNEMFVIPSDEVADSGIEKKFLVPYVKSPTELKNLEFDGNYENYLFVCNLPLDKLKGKYNGAYNWIQKFKNAKNKNGTKTIQEACEGHKPFWYSLRPKQARIVTAINPFERFFFSYAEEQFTIDQRLVAITVNEGNDIELITALLNSVVTFLNIEMRGTSRNLGALDLNANYFKALRVLNPNILTVKAKQKIKKAFQPLKGREIETIFAELKKQDRTNFDKVILRSFGIDEKILPSLYQILSSAVYDRVTMKEK